GVHAGYWSGRRDASHPGRARQADPASSGSRFRRAVPGNRGVAAAGLRDRPEPGHPAGRGRGRAGGGRGLSDRLRGRGPQPGVRDVRPRLRRAGPAGGAGGRRYAREVIEVEVPYDSAVPAARVAEAFRRRPDITVVSVVHCETPCGTVNDLDTIAAGLAEHGALLIVDAVASFGGIRCDFTSWQADLVVVAPQKCLGGPPGLSLLHVSEAAWAQMAANPAAPRGSAL